MGRGLDNVAWIESGGYLVPGEAMPRDHRWLLVGEERAIFDPTWAQFAGLGPAHPARYLAAGQAPPRWIGVPMISAQNAGEAWAGADPDSLTGTCLVPRFIMLGR